MTYKITNKMESLMLDILILKQIVSNNNISSRKKLEKNIQVIYLKIINIFIQMMTKTKK